MYVDEKILNQFSSIREVFKDQPIRRLISEDDRIDLIKRAKTEFIDCVEREKVLDDKNIITVQTKEYGSIEVIPVDTIADIELADVQPVNQWISVEDRLPESEKEVLVWYKYTWDAGFTSYGFGINVWYSNTKQWRDGCLLKGVEVLYWQPLPKPPKDGERYA